MFIFLGAGFFVCIRRCVRGDGWYCIVMMMIRVILGLTQKVSGLDAFV